MAENPLTTRAKEEEKAIVKEEKAAKEADKAAEEQVKEQTKKVAELKAADDERQSEAKASAKRSDKLAEEAKELKVKEAAECLEQATAILKEYDNTESNIPVASSYWSLMNRYRGLLSK